MHHLLELARMSTETSMSARAAATPGHVRRPPPRAAAHCNSKFCKNWFFIPERSGANSRLAIDDKAVHVRRASRFRAMYCAHLRRETGNVNARRIKPVCALVLAGATLSKTPRREVGTRGRDAQGKRPKYGRNRLRELGFGTPVTPRPLRNGYGSSTPAKIQAEANCHRNSNMFARVGRIIVQTLALAMLTFGQSNV